MKSLTETSQKRYGSTSAWIFFTETIFLTNFERFLNTRRAEPICSALLPLFIGEKREVVAAQLAQASLVASTRRHRLRLEPSGRPKWAWLLFAPPFHLIHPPFVFFLFSFPFFSFLCSSAFISLHFSTLHYYSLTFLLRESSSWNLRKRQYENQGIFLAIMNERITRGTCW